MENILIAFDNALRTLLAKPVANRAVSADPQTEGPAPINVIESSFAESTFLTTRERKLAGALMRVNHVGEVCAQALYASQSLATQSTSLKSYFKHSGHDELNHLAWTDRRVEELGTHNSYLNPLWYAGAFGIGFLIAKAGGDKLSLGFVAETERQVVKHLESHLKRLPKGDLESRAIVKQMKLDEEFHSKEAVAKGAKELPMPLKFLMRGVAKVMTRTAHYI